MPAGLGVYAIDGYIGANRNAGQTSTVVLATYLYIEVLNSVHHHQSVTVSPGPSAPTP